MPDSELVIRPAQAGDIEAVHALAGSWLLGNVENPSEQGFFVSNFPKSKYHECLEYADCFFVAEKDGALAGFLLAWHCEHIKGDEVVNSLLKYMALEPFTLVKQICSVPGMRGVAGALYRRLFECMETEYALAAVVNQPFNLRSVEFHRRLGFRHFLEVQAPADPDGETRTRSIWCYGKNGKSVPVRIAREGEKEQLDQLMQTERIITSLYVHEDNLNWTKLGMLLTLMTALVTLFAILIEREASLGDGMGIPVLVLVLGGLVVNALFMGKIRSGVRFMRCHKENMIGVGDDIRRISPTRKALFNPETGKPSFTVRLMGAIPVLSTLTWVACSIALVVRFFS